MNKGRLYLIPTLIADGNVDSVIPEGNLSIIRRLDHFIVEEVRTARRFLIKAGTLRNINEITFLIFNEHSKEIILDSYLACTQDGHDIGLLSEAGAPCIADPGSMIVKEAHEMGIRIVPLSGPSSIMLALMASGFNGQNFSFLGYLPADKESRVKKIKELERTIQEKDQTQIFIETPYRNLQLFDSLISVCREGTLLCIATGISGADEQIESKSIGAWKKSRPDINKRPSIFLLFH
ncbi:MAG: SAM-dependent methyltransferase [Bacteroidota bacterium]